MAIKKLSLEGEVRFTASNGSFQGPEIALLEAIHRTGSITKGAKRVGVSYKTAWEMVEHLNNLAPKPLIERTAGGKNGGGTLVTDAGLEAIRAFRRIEAEHGKFLKILSGTMTDFEEHYGFFRRIMTMKLSARNILFGKVTKIKEGPVSAEIDITLKGGGTVAAVITHESRERLGVQVGSGAYAIIKASSVIVAKDIGGSRISARNVLEGKVSKLVEGKVNSEVDILLPGGDAISAVITGESRRALQLKEGDEVAAVFKANSVIIGVD